MKRGEKRGGPEGKVEENRKENEVVENRRWKWEKRIEEEKRISKLVERANLDSSLPWPIVIPRKYRSLVSTTRFHVI
jgi:hypothetical protein